MPEPERAGEAERDVELAVPGEWQHVGTGLERPVEGQHEGLRRRDRGRVGRRVQHDDEGIGLGLAAAARDEPERGRARLVEGAGHGRDGDVARGVGCTGELHRRPQAGVRAHPHARRHLDRSVGRDRDARARSHRHDLDVAGEPVGGRVAGADRLGAAGADVLEQPVEVRHRADLSQALVRAQRRGDLEVVLRERAGVELLGADDELEQVRDLGDPLVPQGVGDDGLEVDRVALARRELHRPGLDRIGIDAEGVGEVEQRDPQRALRGVGQRHGERTRPLVAARVLVVVEPVQPVHLREGLLACLDLCHDGAP